MHFRSICTLVAIFGLPLGGGAQWLGRRDSGTPRTRDGKPNLSARVPRVNGKPDLSGIWEVESSSPKEVERYLLPGGINGLGEDTPSKYFLNFFSDFPFGKEPFQPAAATLFQQRLRSSEKPPTLCMPPTLPIADMIPGPFKIVQLPKMVIVLYEGDTSFFRQIFTDGRTLPDDPQPSWLGYSIGRWDGDRFIVDSVGFNERGRLDAMGHFHSEAMRFTETMRRRDFGHLEMDLTVNDPKTYTQPITVHVNFRLLPDTELLESFCSEGEQDLAHIGAN